MSESRAIKDILLARGNGAFFYDDQAAIRAGAVHDGFGYVGIPVTPGFPSIRVPAQSLSIGLVLHDDTVVWGDMMGVQYSGAGGRDALFDAEEIETLTRAIVGPRLLAADTSHYLVACDAVFEETGGTRLPLSIEYGVSQALLQATAHDARVTPAEVLCREFGLPIIAQRVPIYGQSGDAREINTEKMILKSVDVLPHGLINAPAKFGHKGEIFRQFVTWVAKRIDQLGAPGYRPVLHFDLYGCAGLEFGLDPQALADFMSRVADDVPGFTVQIESPADFGSTEAQLDGCAKIVAILGSRQPNVRLVVDEHCNTLDDIRIFAQAKATHLVQIKMPDVGSIADSARAVRVCKENGVGAFLGGSCTETDLSARLSVHVAIATQADMMLAKPGMGVDEALSIVGNEQNRLLSLLGRRLTSRN